MIIQSNKPDAYGLDEKKLSNWYSSSSRRLASGYAATVSLGFAR